MDEIIISLQGRWWFVKTLNFHVTLISAVGLVGERHADYLTYYLAYYLPQL